MAVTGAIFEKLIFGGVDSSLYGIYITGEAVYNAPKRAVEMVSVPGRNGAVAIDQGYWENITVTYPAGTFAGDQADFADAVSAFRNALASQIGYQRLEDTYHPDEYRMAMFVDGVEVAPVNRSEAGQFNISFTCKPQRWLKSGETAVTVSDGDTITNPTLYGASPLLAVDGTGTINLGEQSITVQERALGRIVVNSGGTFELDWVSDVSSRIIKTITLDTSNLTEGDVITIGAVKITDTSYDYKNRTVTVLDDSTLNGATISWEDGKNVTTWVSVPAGTITFTYGTTVASGELVRNCARIKIAESTQTYNDLTVGILRWVYDGDATITIEVGAESRHPTLQLDEITAYSTKTVRDTTYIDLDVGEAYWIQDGKAVDANSMVTLGSDLPVLESGANTITYDSTITSLTITPRWWQL